MAVLNIIDKLFNQRKPVEVEGNIEGDIALEGKLDVEGKITAGGNLEVDGDVQMNSDLEVGVTGGSSKIVLNGVEVGGNEIPTIDCTDINVSDLSSLTLEQFFTKIGYTTGYKCGLAIFHFLSGDFLCLYTAHQTYQKELSCIIVHPNYSQQVYYRVSGDNTIIINLGRTLLVPLLPSDVTKSYTLKATPSPYGYLNYGWVEDNE